MISLGAQNKGLYVCSACHMHTHCSLLIDVSVLVCMCLSCIFFFCLMSLCAPVINHLATNYWIINLMLPYINLPHALKHCNGLKVFTFNASLPSCIKIIRNGNQWSVFIKFLFMNISYFVVSGPVKTLLSKMSTFCTKENCCDNTEPKYYKRLITLTVHEQRLKCTWG